MAAWYRRPHAAFGRSPRRCLRTTMAPQASRTLRRRAPPMTEAASTSANSQPAAAGAPLRPPVADVGVHAGPPRPPPPAARLMLTTVTPRQRLSALVLLLAVAGGLLLVGLVNPSDGSVLPACPTWRYLGLHCPGCGSTRATHWLLNGSVESPPRARRHRATPGRGSRRPVHPGTCSRPRLRCRRRSPAAGGSSQSTRRA